MISIKANDATNLSFEMMIEGAAQSIEKVSLCIETELGFDIKIPAKYENGLVESTIPVLANILNEGEYQITLDVQIDGKVYQPLQESVKIEKPVEVKAKLTESIERTIEKKEEPKFKPMSLSRAILNETSQIAANNK